MAHTPTSLLLLSGAGLPAWIWDGVSSATDSLLPTVTPELPRTADTSLGELADAAAAAADPGPIAVVAHSSGGCVAAELVADIPDA
jgi:pimeloyl-ACP methyl ester carboxylesterase